MRGGLWYTGVAGLIAAAVAGVGVALVEGSARDGVLLGAGVGLVVQVLGFWLLFVLAFPDRPVLAHGLGMLGRLIAVLGVALLGLPLLGASAAPMLLSLVTVLFLTTLVEPVILQIATSKRR